VLFALVSATSPLALASVLIVLTGSRARVKGTALAVGFVVGQSAFLLLVFAIGISSSPDGKNHPAVVDGIVIAFGIALLATAVHVRRHRSDPPAPPSPRTTAIHARLANLRPVTALGTGAVLGIGGPKRVGLTIVVSAAIAASGLESAEAVGLAVLYVAVATILVWVPVVLYVALGPRATEGLANAQRWIAQHKQPITFYPSAVLGAVLVADGVAHLISIV
jgi:hypothetical protein